MSGMSTLIMSIHLSLPSAGLLRSAHVCWPQNLLAIINTQHGTVWPRLRAAHLCSLFCSIFCRFLCRLYCICSFCFTASGCSTACRISSPVVVGVPARHLHHVSTQDRQPRPGRSSCNISRYHCRYFTSTISSKYD